MKRLLNHIDYFHQILLAYTVLHCLETDLQNQRTSGPVNAHLISGIITKDKMAEQALTLITNNT